MKSHHHAWIAVLTLGTAIALEPPDEGGKPPRGKPAEREAQKGNAERRDRGDWMARVWKEADLDGDGFISAAEFAAMERPSKLPEDKRKLIFERLDKDGDGRIGPDEMPRKHPGGMRPLEDVDANKDGRIDFGEFQNLGFVARLPEERQREIFRRMDRDGDGFITPKDREYGKSPRDRRRDGKGGRGSGERNPAELIRSLDSNGDGSLSFEEFRKAPFLAGMSEDEQEARFEELDRNGDLKIDAADFGRPEKGGERGGRDD